MMTDSDKPTAKITIDGQPESVQEKGPDIKPEKAPQKEAAMPVIIALLGYGAVILSFVGALGWGSHLRDEQIMPSKYIWSIVPALIGWFALMAPLQIAASMIIIGLLACWWADRAHIKKGVWPKWMGRLRTHLTVLACLSLSALLVF